MKTIQMSKELKIDTAQFTGVVAYPGTSYYKWAEENGALIPKNWRDWVTDDYEQAATINLPTLNKRRDQRTRRQGSQANSTSAPNRWPAWPSTSPPGPT